jgi:hypothetical protein
MEVMAGAGAVASASAVEVEVGEGAGFDPCSSAEAASFILFMRIGIREFSYCFIAVSLSFLASLLVRCFRLARARRLSSPKSLSLFG